MGLVTNMVPFPPAGNADERMDAIKNFLTVTLAGLFTVHSDTGSGTTRQLEVKHVYEPDRIIRFGPWTSTAYRYLMVSLLKLDGATSLTTLLNVKYWAWSTDLYFMYGTDEVGNGFFCFDTQAELRNLSSDGKDTLMFWFKRADGTGRVLYKSSMYYYGKVTDISMSNMSQGFQTSTTLYFENLAQVVPFYLADESPFLVPSKVNNVVVFLDPSKTFSVFSDVIIGTDTYMVLYTSIYGTLAIKK